MLEAATELDLDRDGRGHTINCFDVLTRICGVDDVDYRGSTSTVTAEHRTMDTPALPVDLSHPAVREYLSLIRYHPSSPVAILY
jgi:hypothetical protein